MVKEISACKEKVIIRDEIISSTKIAHKSESNLLLLEPFSKQYSRTYRIYSHPTIFWDDFQPLELLNFQKYVKIDFFYVALNQFFGVKFLRVVQELSDKIITQHRHTILIN